MPRSSSKKNSRASRGVAQRIVRWLFHPSRLLVLGCVALAWVCWPAVQDKLPDLESRREFLVGPEEISINAPPRWVPEDLVSRAYERANFDGKLSLHDPQLVEKIGLAFHTHPWVERLKQVKKCYPARVQVEVVYRTPVAMVEVAGGGCLPVDRHGVLLPYEDFSSADLDRYPTITNVSSIPVRRGQSWGDPAVHGAAELAGVLVASDETNQSWWQTLGLRSIIAPEVRGDVVAANLQYRLVTEGRSEVLWGRAPSTDHPAELKVSQKLARMVEYHRSYNGFDDAPAPFLIDIRDWQGTKRSLLAAAPDESAVRH